MVSVQDKSEIAFFDLETTYPVPAPTGQKRAILEFGSILVCPRTFKELSIYSTLVHPSDISLISVRSHGISRQDVVSAPTFAQIADRVFDILDGRIWAGHNINRFDCCQIREAFQEINRPAPEPKGTIDTLPLLEERFGRRAGDMKMASLATYFGLGKQSHRSLADVRMNLEVLKYCSTVLFLESSLPWVSPNENLSTANSSDAYRDCIEFLKPCEISVPCINVVLAPGFQGLHKLHILHNNSVLHICCKRMKVRFGKSTKFVDYYGRPRLNFVLDASPDLCQILDACDNLAEKTSLDSGSSSDWWPVVARKAGFPTIRLHLPIVRDGSYARLSTEIYQKESSSNVVFSGDDFAELDALLTPGTFMDAYFSLDPYDYEQNAGIRLVAKQLVFV